MKSSTRLQLFLVGFGCVLLSATATGATADESILSPASRAKVRSGLPAYSAPVPARLTSNPGAPVTVFHTPNLALSRPATAQTGIVRRMTEESLYARGAFDRELAKRELTVLDRCFLNRFTLPLVGISTEQRARAAYRERQHRRFHDEVTAFARIVQLTSPTDAAAVRACLWQWQ